MHMARQPSPAQPPTKMLQCIHTQQMVGSRETDASLMLAHTLRL